MADWDGNTCYIDAERPCFFDIVLGNIPHVFEHTFDTRSLNVLSRTSRSMMRHTCNQLTRSVDVRLDGTAHASRLASYMRAWQLRPPRHLTVSGNHECSMVEFVRGAAPCLDLVRDMKIKGGYGLSLGAETSVALGAHMPCLTGLTIQCMISAQAVSALSGVSSLKRLNITQCKAGAIGALTALTNLSELSIGVSNDDDAAAQAELASLASLPNLSSLDLGNTCLEDAGSHALLNTMPSLTYLRFAGPFSSPSNISCHVGQGIRTLVLIEPTLSGLGRLVVPQACTVQVEGDVYVDHAVHACAASVHLAHRQHLSLMCPDDVAEITPANAVAVLGGLADGFAAVGCTIDMLEIENFNLDGICRSSVQRLIQAIPQLDLFRFEYCNLHPDVLRAIALHSRAFELYKCDTCPSDVAALLGELHMGAAPARFTLEAESELLEEAVKLAKRRGWWDDEAEDWEDDEGVLCIRMN